MTTEVRRRAVISLRGQQHEKIGETQVLSMMIVALVAGAEIGVSGPG